MEKDDTTKIQKPESYTAAQLPRNDHYRDNHTRKTDPEDGRSSVMNKGKTIAQATASSLLNED